MRRSFRSIGGSEPNNKPEYCAKEVDWMLDIVREYERVRTAHTLFDKVFEIAKKQNNSELFEVLSPYLKKQVNEMITDE